MARINLLPWRAERRKQRQKSFMTMLAFAALAGVAAWFLVNTYYNNQIDGQNERNAYLKEQIAQLDTQIKEIEKLDEQKARLLSRKEVIEQLQANRSQMVHLFDSLVRTIPDGVTLTSIKQEGEKLTLEGRSQSNARVSTYMRNLEGSGWMTKPDLSVIEAKGEVKGLPYVFTLAVMLANPNAARDDNGDGVPDAVPPVGEPSTGTTPAATPAQPPAPAAAPAPPPAAAPATRSCVVSKKKMSLKELDFNNTGSWPRQFQIGFCVLLGLLIFGLMWWLLTREKGEVLEGLERQETDLRAEFETKQGRAANLEPLKQQLAQMEQQLQQMLRQLPSKTEMPDLITDISQTALATGIQNELFAPGQETPKEFYAEKPIALRMVGTYHQFGAFVSGVASLPRVVIMTMHDISLRPVNADKDPTAGIRPNSNLELAGTVKTYRYLDEEEAAEQEKAAQAATAANEGGQ